MLRGRGTGVGTGVGVAKVLPYFPVGWGGGVGATHWGAGVGIALPRPYFPGMARIPGYTHIKGEDKER